MLLWIGLAVMSAGVLAVLLRPLMRPAPPMPAEVAVAASIYRDQLREIEADRERGLIGAAEAEAAKAEIARRLIAAGDTAARPAGGPYSEAALSRIALVLAAGLPLLAITTYIGIGEPRLPAQPLAARQASPAETARVDELIRAVETRLGQHPEDGQGWDVIAPVYFKQGRHREAADAFGRAIRILGENSKRLAGFAESTVLANDGVITEPARLAYEKLAKLEPGRVEPRFWLAYAREQDGQLETARAEYKALIAGAPADARWLPAVEERLHVVEQRIAGAAAPADRSAPSKQADAPRGPTREEMAAGDKLPEADRRQMIEGMVQSLASRLKQDGRDLSGWERLIRAYSVMGRRAEALAALSDARRNFTSEPQSLDRLQSLARSLGLES